MRKFMLLWTVLSINLFALYSEEIVTLANGKKAVLYDDNTWAYLEESPEPAGHAIIKDNEISSYLRQGIKATKEEIGIAIEMYSQGWAYTMPRPKSPKAAWGNNDARTIWFNGWWYNSKTKRYSTTTPVKRASGLYLGDNQDLANSWSNGGTPPYPDVFMFLLSKEGGPSQPF